MKTATIGNNFGEIPVFCDDQGWIWLFLSQALRQSGAHFVKMPTSTSIRQSWARLKDAPRIVIHWEGKHRSGGAVIEELLEINPQFDVAANIIVIMAVAVRSDIVYLSELGVKRIVRIRHKEDEFRRATEELRTHLREPFTRDPVEHGWLKLQRAVDFLPNDAPAARLQRLVDLGQRLQRSSKVSARHLDLQATLAAARGEFKKAEQLWLEAITINPHFFRAYTKLADTYHGQGQLEKAVDTLHRLHALNKKSIARLVKMGEVQLQMQDDVKAEHFFSRALEEDQYCSLALNGLAEIRFKEGDLEETRKLLSRTMLAYRFAAKLNSIGVNMVKMQEYREALDHYTRAQYVLPNREKGPQLFFNIGLCYFRWGRADMAEEFLKIALIKEPSYKKAEQLLQKIRAAATANKSNAVA